MRKTEQVNTLPEMKSTGPFIPPVHSQVLHDAPRRGEKNQNYFERPGLYMQGKGEAWQPQRIFPPAIRLSSAEGRARVEVL